MNQASPFESIMVVGAGAWGTALANLVAGNGVATMLWAREADVVASIDRDGVNAVYLPDAPLDGRLRATTDLSAAADAEAILLVAPAQHNRATLTELRRVASKTIPVALCAKGIEASTGLFMSDVLAAVWPDARPAVLSGPSFAIDVAKKLPTAVTLACENAALGARWIASLRAPHFRPYLSADLIGAELGGAVKNVLAVAAGVAEGRGLGESARAAVIARGFAEFQRLGVAMGAQAQTMAGLSGLGDLILTASSEKSRNMSLGAALGRGRALGDILKERNTVAEGVSTAPAIVALAAKVGVETPIINAVAALLAGDRSVDALIAALLARPLKPETV